MVGLSIVLEGQKGNNNNNKNGTSSNSHVKTPQVINKLTMTKALATVSSSSSSLTRVRSSYLVATSTSSFLERCFLCKRKLLPAEDIYMYEGDKAFCSVECRCRQIFMDEEEALTATIKREKSCSLAAMRPRHTLSSSSSSSSPCSRNRKVTRNAANGFTAY